MSLKFSQPIEISDYIKAWNKIKIESASQGEVKLKISNSMTGEFCDADLTIKGTTFSTVVTPKPIRTEISNTWEFEGQMSLQIEGAITPTDAFAASKPTEITKLVDQGMLEYIKLNGYELQHSTFIYVALGGIALSLLTGGIGDAALVAGGSLGGLETIASR